ncbi:MAG: hypothetical protein QOJ92_2257 [Frankiales bacterium]|nr:hypothetical protein [Frankiales bacterium]
MNLRPITATLLLAAGLTACSGSGTPTAQPSATDAPSATSSPVTAAPTTPPQKPVPAESNPPGDIPDNLAFVDYANAPGHYSFKHPEGWAEVEHGTVVTFTDKLNGVFVQLGSDTQPPTVQQANQRDVPRLRQSQPAFELRKVTAVTLPGGSGVRIVYRRNSAPDAVTGRQYRDEVERYEIVGHGREVIMELYGPVGADNVDAYRTMSRSLTFS